MSWTKPLALILSCMGLMAGCDDTSDDGGTDDGGYGMCLPREDSPPEAGDCTVESGDYLPCTDDGYDACISDDGQYHPINPTVSSIARVQAFEEMHDLLFDPAADANTDDFADAAFIFARDEGLGSRVERRYDPHFDSQAEGTKCDNDGIVASDPDYCVGPAHLHPLVLQALAEGSDGTEPRANAARIEGALLWFFYVSSYKEGTTCVDKAKDCDSAYSYYTGVGESGDPIGLARRVKAVDPYAHLRAVDGLLGLRCWRDLDDAEMATDRDQRDRARAQYDRAILHGIASILMDRLAQLESSEDDEARYHAAFLATLGPAVDRAIRETSPGDADLLAVELAKPAADMDVTAATGLLAAAFECP